jgi:hypothetical protein
MPKFVYQPEGAEPREWDWEPLKMSSKDAELVESKTGMLFADWVDAVPRGSMLALHALLFVLLRKDSPGLQWDQVEFSLGETGWRLGDEELVGRVVALSRKAQTEQLTEDEGAVLDAYRGSLSEVQLAQVAAELEPEESEPEDPTQPASEPESEHAAGKPGKKKP